MSAVITLTTDFGLNDAYVAAMKGVILGINPEVNMVDICHTIQPQNVSQAAFVLSTVYDVFPRRTVHLVVVDPGVGTERRSVILRTPEADFVAPDNGVLSYVVRQYVSGQTGGGIQSLDKATGLKAVTLTEPRFWRSPVSPTFHGRDIFAPVAAHLASGVPLSDFGTTIDSLSVLLLPRPFRSPEGILVGNVLHIDNFGNLITNIKREDLPENTSMIVIEIGDRKIYGISLAYGKGQGLMAIIGSSDYLEISLKDGNARDYLEAKPGNEVKIITKD